MISRYCLDAKPYNTDWFAVTWETCSLRSWLNNSFYNTAFSTAEKDKILTTTVQNENNPDYGTSGGNTTYDKVFLLSISEALSYFVSDAARISYPTQYALNNGCRTGLPSSNPFENTDNGACWWWLRSPGQTNSDAAFVHGNGVIRSINIEYDFYAVRPALWYDLGS